MKTREKKFTEGPWKQSVTHPMSGSAWFVVTDKNGYGPIMDVGGKDQEGQIAEAKYLITDPEEIKANAHLISAAPELLEFAEDKCNICFARWQGDHYDMTNDEIRQEVCCNCHLGKILAKAYGETP
jgi:hypothetical protein